MSIVFLLPPSEGKNISGIGDEEQLSYIFEKPLELAIHATPKDLKCKDKRYNEAIVLNTNLKNGPYNKAILRYSGVMYNAINYLGMTQEAKSFFCDHFLILSGMYGIVKPLDKIGNYKLPIETKGLYSYWGHKITESLSEINPDYIVNLLPGAYTKMIDLKKLNIPVIHINFLHEKEGKLVKISHGVKKIKGEWIKNICEQKEIDFNNFGGKVVKMGKNIDVNIL